MENDKLPENHRKTMELLGVPHRLLIIALLMEGEKPFHELADTISPYISHRRMYLIMRSLQQAGIVEESFYHKRLALTEYSLTEKGEAFRPVVQAIHSWAHHQWEE